MGQRTGSAAELGERALQMDRQRVMDVAGNAVLGQARLERVALRRTYDVEVEDTVGRRAADGAR